MLRALLVTLLLGMVDFPTIPPIPYASIQRIQTSEEGFCTAFSINEQEGYWATAAHCIHNPAPLLQGKVVTVVMVNAKEDTAVFQSIHAPAFTLLNDIPDPQTPVWKWGYGDQYGGQWGSEPWTSEGRLTDEVLDHPMVGHLVFIMHLYVEPGDSGAPILDYAGRVVSMCEVKFGKDDLSGGILSDVLYNLLLPYLPKAL